MYMHCLQCELHDVVRSRGVASLVHKCLKTATAYSVLCSTCYCTVVYM